MEAPPPRRALSSRATVARVSGTSDTRPKTTSPKRGAAAPGPAIETTIHADRRSCMMLRVPSMGSRAIRGPPWSNPSSSMCPPSGAGPTCRQPASSVMRESGLRAPSRSSQRVTCCSATTSMAKVTSPAPTLTASATESREARPAATSASPERTGLRISAQSSEIASAQSLGADDWVPVIPRAYDGHQGTPSIEPLEQGGPCALGGRAYTSCDPESSLTAPVADARASLSAGDPSGRKP